MARDGGDQWLGEEGSQVGPGLNEGLSVCLGEGEWSHLLDVGTCGEGTGGAGEDDGSDVGVGLIGAECLVDLGDERGGEGIECLWTVDGH